MHLSSIHLISALETTTLCCLLVTIYTLQISYMRCQWAGYHAQQHSAGEVDLNTDSGLKTHRSTCWLMHSGGVRQTWSAQRVTDVNESQSWILPLITKYTQPFAQVNICVIVLVTQRWISLSHVRICGYSRTSNLLFDRSFSLASAFIRYSSKKKNARRPKSLPSCCELPPVGQRMLQMLKIHCESNTSSIQHCLISNVRALVTIWCKE